MMAACVQPATYVSPQRATVPHVDESHNQHRESLRGLRSIDTAPTSWDGLDAVRLHIRYTFTHFSCAER